MEELSQLNKIRLDFPIKTTFQKIALPPTFSCSFFATMHCSALSSVYSVYTGTRTDNYYSMILSKLDECDIIARLSSQVFSVLAW